MRPRRPLLALLALLATASVARARPAVIPVTLPSGTVLQTEVMVEDADRAMGLMFRPSLPAGRALLFVFEEPGFHGIWMKNCRFPIDILWLDESGKVVHLAEAVPPCTTPECPSYQPMRKASYVIEMGAGQARRERALVGTRVTFRWPQ